MIMEKNLTPIASDNSVSIMTMMREAATQLDTDKLEKLMALQERVLDRDAKAAFAADFIRMKPDLPRVVRMKKNTQTDSKYAPLEDINGQIDPVLASHGFGTSTKIMSQTADSVTVRAELWHRDGHIEETTVTMPLDNMGAKGTVNKTMPHATASSITYAKRVAICALLQISTGDDKDGSRPTNDEEPLANEVAVAMDVRINKLADAVEYKKRFLKYMGYESIQEIKVKDFKKAINAIEQKEKASK